MSGLLNDSQNTTSETARQQGKSRRNSSPEGPPMASTSRKSSLTTVKTILKKTKKLRNLDGTGTLHARYWIPKDERGERTRPQALVFISHGLAEHLNVYDELAGCLCQTNVLCFGHDHPGHGLSDGKRGLVTDIKVLVQELLKHCHQMKMEYPGVPLFIYGHSMGGLVAVKAGMFNAAMFKGIVLEGPLLELRASLSKRHIRHTVQLLNMISAEFPLLPLELGDITSDESAYIALEDDPLRFKGAVKAGSLNALIDAINETTPNFKKFSVPYLILHGELDNLCVVDGSREFHDNTLEVEDRSLIVIPDVKHHLLLEKKQVRLQVLNETVNWIRQRAIKV